MDKNNGVYLMLQVRLFDSSKVRFLERRRIKTEASTIRKETEQDHKRLFSFNQENKKRFQKWLNKKSFSWIWNTKQIILRRKKTISKFFFLHTYTTPLLLSAAVLAPALTFFDCNDN